MAPPETSFVGAGSPTSPTRPSTRTSNRSMMATRQLGRRGALKSEAGRRYPHDNLYKTSQKGENRKKHDFEQHFYKFNKAFIAYLKNITIPDKYKSPKKKKKAKVVVKKKKSRGKGKKNGNKVSFRIFADFLGG
jgi:hypothetical protein